jgi:hypothetical protein
MSVILGESFNKSIFELLKVTSLKLKKNVGSVYLSISFFKLLILFSSSKIGSTSLDNSVATSLEGG